MIGRGRGRAVAVVFLAGVMACASAQSGGSTVATKSIDQVLAAHTDSLMALPGVVGTAIGLYEGERCIKVLVVDSGSGAIKKIPDHLEGYRVVVEVTGTIRPH
jgi:hypothetical protein